MTLRDDALRIVHAAISAADPRAAVRRALRVDGGRLTIGGERAIDLASVDRILVLGAGKAVVGMTRGAIDVLGERIRGGAVTAPEGDGAPIGPVEAWTASHPVPDTRGLAGAVAALETARSAGARDLVLCLLSGGASALWPAPPAGVSLSALQAATRRLLRAGAPIAEINAVRKHLSRIAGGRLARAAHPAAVVTLIVSDVVGSPPDAIASGPTVPDPTTYEDALDVVRRREIDVPPTVLTHLQAGAMGEHPETPKPGSPGFERDSWHVIARNADALEGAAREAERLGYRAVRAGDDMEGEAREVARAVARTALDPPSSDDDSRPVAILIGGETTVTVRGPGRGGRNQEMALAVAREIAGREGIVVACVGTDGVDGPTGAAGGIVDGGTVARGRAAGLDAGEALDRNDSHPFLKAAGDLLVTGPTGTNVNDVVVILVDPSRPS